MRENAHIDDKIMPLAVRRYGQRRIALVAQRRKRVGRKEEAAENGLRIVVPVPQREKGPFVRGKLDRGQRYGAVGTHGGYGRKPELRNDSALPHGRGIGRVPVVEDPNRLGGEKRAARKRKRGENGDRRQTK